MGNSNNDYALGKKAESTVELFSTVKRTLQEEVAEMAARGDPLPDENSSYEEIDKLLQNCSSWKSMREALAKSTVRSILEEKSEDEMLQDNARQQVLDILNNGR